MKSDIEFARKAQRLFQTGTDVRNDIVYELYRIRIYLALIQTILHCIVHNVMEIQ